MDNKNKDWLGNVKGMIFIIACTLLSLTAMKMTNNPNWIWFILIGLFAL